MVRWRGMVRFVGQADGVRWAGGQEHEHELLWLIQIMHIRPTGICIGYLCPLGVEAVAGSGRVIAKAG